MRLPPLLCQPGLFGIVMKIAIVLLLSLSLQVVSAVRIDAQISRYNYTYPLAVVDSLRTRPDLIRLKDVHFGYEFAARVDSTLGFQVMIFGPKITALEAFSKIESLIDLIKSSKASKDDWWRESSVGYWYRFHDAVAGYRYLASVNTHDFREERDPNLTGPPIPVSAWGMIKGKVLDKETKEPLPYATVVVITTDLNAMSRDDGSFTIDAVPTGSYIIRAFAMGYRTAILNYVLARRDSIKELVIELEKTITAPPLRVNRVITK